MKKSKFLLAVLTAMLFIGCSDPKEEVSSNNEDVKILHRTIIEPKFVHDNSGKSSSGTYIYLSSSSYEGAPTTVSTHGIYTYSVYNLVQQTDSNLVLYHGSPSNNEVIWNVGCIQPILNPFYGTSNGYHLVSQSDGNAVIYRGGEFTAPNAIWYTNTQVAGATFYSQHLELQTYSKRANIFSSYKTYVKLSLYRDSDGYEFKIFDKEITS